MKCNWTSQFRCSFSAVWLDEVDLSNMQGKRAKAGRSVIAHPALSLPLNSSYRSGTFTPFREEIKCLSGCSLILQYGSSVHWGFIETSLPISQWCDGSLRQLWSCGMFRRIVTECPECVGSVLNPAHSAGKYWSRRECLTDWLIKENVKGWTSSHLKPAQYARISLTHTPTSS